MENTFVSFRPLIGLKTGINDNVSTMGAIMSKCAKKLKENDAEAVVTITWDTPKIQVEKTSW